MRVFVTGASGFIGSAVVQELIGAGHQVLGLTRSDAGAQSLAASGSAVLRGDVNDLDAVRRAAADSDGVIHLAFNHDFSRFAQNCDDDRRVIAALGDALAGSDRRLIVTSGTAIANVPPGQLATEDAPPVPASVFPRAASEEALDAVTARGVNASAMRLPQVHAREAQGLITYLIRIAREKGTVAYVGDGANRWPAAHRLDVARLYRLALEHGTAGTRYNAVAEEGVPARDIAAVIGRRLHAPVVSISADEAPAYFGWMAHLAATDMPASSALTRQRLGWNPTGIGLLDDLEQNAQDLETPLVAS
ncbi:MAG TPA: SDR family oxidoreductase [Candidatus Sulfotelmatobacter sp.]|nr:SDR family oxidoreductase [Candidatus Sulfotelmatobacter sp.]